MSSSIKITWASNISGSAHVCASVEIFRRSAGFRSEFRERISQAQIERQRKSTMVANVRKEDCAIVQIPLRENPRGLLIVVAGLQYLIIEKDLAHHLPRRVQFSAGLFNRLGGRGALEQHEQVGFRIAHRSREIAMVPFQDLRYKFNVHVLLGRDQRSVPGS
jgi:hypothetical protein